MKKTWTVYKKRRSSTLDLIVFTNWYKYNNHYK